MRTQFVIHKTLVSPVYRVLPNGSRLANFIDKWHPEDVLVHNPIRKGAFFILPKFEYVPCNKNGVVKDKHVETTNLSDSGAQSAG